MNIEPAKDAMSAMSAGFVEICAVTTAILANHQMQTRTCVLTSSWDSQLAFYSMTLPLPNDDTCRKQIVY